MALELVTGYWGMEHVTAEQDADLNAGIIGSRNYVLNIGEKMRAEAVSANQVRIFDGIFMAYGRQCILGDGEYEDVTIENGTPGLLRNDMIVVKYKKDEESGKENATFVVLKGETGGVAKDPVPNNQDIRSGAFESEVPMYRVKINGLAIEKIEPLFTILMTNDELSALALQKIGYEEITDTNYMVANKKIKRYSQIVGIDSSGQTTVDLSFLNASYIWVDMTQSYTYHQNLKDVYPLSYVGETASIFYHITGSGRLYIDTKGDWTGYAAMISVLFY